MKAFAYGIALAGLVLVARSASGDASLDRVRACMPQQNDAARLACYDKELGRTSATTRATPAAPAVARATTPSAPASAGAPTAPAPTAAVASAATPASAAKAADFGMTPQLERKHQVEAGLKPTPPPPPESLAAKVTKIGTYGNGLLVLTLDNGQVWQQEESGDMQLAVGDAVKISHGMFGALWMDDASHRRMRVKRVE